jgi:hypothetical protein
MKNTMAIALNKERDTASKVLLSAAHTKYFRNKDQKKQMMK